MADIDTIQNEACKAFGEEAAKNVFGFVNDITSPPAKELGGLIADQIRYFRFKTQFNILKKARAFVEEQCSGVEKVSLKVLAPLLENCSWEENEALQDKWAALLINAVSVDVKHENIGTYVELLRQITPTQATLLDFLFTTRFNALFVTIPSYISSHKIIEMLNIKEEEYSILCESLVRLNLIRPIFKYSKEHQKTYGSLFQFCFDEISLTSLGKDFVIKCRPPFTECTKSKIKMMLKENLDEIVKEFFGNGERPNFTNFFLACKKSNRYFCKKAFSAAIHLSASNVLDLMQSKNFKNRYKFIPLGNKNKVEIIDHFITYLEGSLT